MFGTPTVFLISESENVTSGLPSYIHPKVFEKVFAYVVEKGNRGAAMIERIKSRLKMQAAGVRQTSNISEIFTGYGFTSKVYTLLLTYHLGYCLRGRALTRIGLPPDHRTG